MMQDADYKVMLDGEKIQAGSLLPRLLRKLRPEVQCRKAAHSLHLVFSIR